MSTKIKDHRYLGGVLLVAGTCIGAGMIGVPVKTAVAGFGPTLIAFGLVWLIMTLSALLFLEVSLDFPGEVNFITMSKIILGPVGKNIAWLTSLLYMYSMMAAYTSGGGTMLAELLPVNVYVAILVYLLPFAILVYFGAKWIDLINRFFTIGLIVSFVILCVSTLISARSLQPIANFAANKSVIESFKLLTFGLPLLVTTFGYHVIIPSLKCYLQEEVNFLKKAIFVGGFIPLIVYIVWQIVILLLIPAFGNEGLVSMLESNKNPGDSIASYLLRYGQHKMVVISLTSFMFCAISSSLIGVSWALCDFFADGFKIAKNCIGKLILIFLTFVPAIIYAVCFPQGFLKALGWSGVFSAIIMVIYPALMAYKLRTISKNPVKYKAPIGKILIIAVILFGLLVAGLELIK